LHINGTPQTLVEKEDKEEKEKYITSEDEQNRIEEKTDELYDQLSEDDYDEFLNDSNEDVSVCGMTYKPAKVLYACDRTAYDEGFNDYRDNERDYLYERASEIVAEELVDEGLEVREV